MRASLRDPASALRSFEAFVFGKSTKHLSSQISGVLCEREDERRGGSVKEEERVE